MALEDSMRSKLMEALEPVTLTIENQSHLHKGHRGSPGTGESHFKITIVSKFFEEVSNVQRHQKIYAILKEELNGPIHALSIHAQSPAEAL